MDIVSRGCAEALRWVVYGDALAQAVLCVALLGLLRDALAVRYRRGPEGAAGVFPAVSILKPVHGGEPLAEAAFRAYCLLDYPAPYEVIFALEDEAQPLYPLVQALAAEFPARVRCVLSGPPRDAGVNGKSHNLAAAARLATYDWLLISDSDTLPDAFVLRRFAAALADARVAAVSATPRVSAARGLPARLERLLVNAVLAPFEYAAAALHAPHGLWGTLLLVRRDAVVAAGGFVALGRHLAEDIALEKALRQRGLRTAHVCRPIDVACADLTLGDLLRHWQRWLVGLRTMKPLTYACMALILLGWLLPVAALASLWLLPGATGERGVALAVFTGASATSLFVVGRAAIGVREPPTSYLLLPAAIVVLLAAFVLSACDRRVEWRGRRLRVGRDGRICADACAPPAASPVRPRRFRRWRRPAAGRR